MTAPGSTPGAVKRGSDWTTDCMQSLLSPASVQRRPATRKSGIAYGPGGRPALFSGPRNRPIQLAFIACEPPATARCRQDPVVTACTVRVRRVQL